MKQHNSAYVQTKPQHTYEITRDAYQKKCTKFFTLLLMEFDKQAVATTAV